MGDRGNIVIRTNGTNLFLYTHWRGCCIGSIAHAALSKRERWSDPGYLARIVFQEMIGNDTSTLGFAISADGPPDNEHDFLVLECDSGHVLRCKAKNRKIGAEAERWTFLDFIAAKPIEDWN